MIGLRAVVDDIRRARASELLRTTSRELADISHALGYSDVRALHRACRRWFGESALAHRRAR